MLGLLDYRDRTKRFVTERSEVIFPLASAIFLYLSHPYPYFFTTFFVTSNFSIYFPTINRVCA